ncbi:hypothetical protein [Natrinema halophilum]|uniref:Uncharacterized protein n=1 Tax=Natrinema halophilum TaxID=1699371 RepID=A0A7D5KB95_9EURY|nr:hypothetical protein [Natrinema halophilum]QLG47581.1 hypothetical protein HYG82_01320 [Natrinema halophilum]
MSTRPTGTVLDDDRLLALRGIDATAASKLGIEVTPVAEDVGASAGDHIDWDVDRHEEQPMLVFSGIEETATADAPYPRKLREENGDIVAPVPDPLIRAEPPEGMGIDIDTYDTERPLLFDAITTGETIGLIPIRFDDGESYRPEPLPETGGDSDPVAAEIIDHENRGDPMPRAETMDAPIDPQIFESTLAECDATTSDTMGILQAIETHDLVGTGDHVAGVPPLAADDRVVCMLPEGVWSERFGPRLEGEGIAVDEDSLAAGRVIHERQGRALIDAAETTKYEGIDDEYALVVTEARDTAEWDDTATDASR